MNRKIACLLLGILTLCSSCSRKEDTGEPRNVRIGFSSVSETYLLERWNRDLKIFAATARELGADINVQIVPGEAEEQIQQIRYLIEQDIDVLVVIPQDMYSLTEVVKRAKDKGISVLAYDRLIMDVEIDGYVSFDNREVGRLFGRALTEEVPEGDYLIVNGSIRDNNSFEVSRGLYEILRPSIDQGKITVAQEIWLEEWSFDEALLKIGEFLDTGVSVDAVSAANDQIADAAIRLLAERQMAGSVAVVGQDADILSCQRVVEGTQLMTVYKSIPTLAERAAHLAVAIGRGETPEPDRTIANGSSRDIPFYMETPVAVTRDLMDSTIIADGFHSYEDVYRNVRER